MLAFGLASAVCASCPLVFTLSFFFFAFGEKKDLIFCVRERLKGCQRSHYHLSSLAQQGICLFSHQREKWVSVYVECDSVS